MSVSRRQAMKLIAGAVPAFANARAFGALPQTSGSLAAKDVITRFVLDGISSELRMSVQELGQESPADLSVFTHLVMEMRMSSPQRLLLWLYTTNGPRSVSIIGFGQNAWLRASIPLEYFVGRESSGESLASGAKVTEQSA